MSGMGNMGFGNGAMISGGGAGTGAVVENFIPAAGSPIQPYSQISFDVTVPVGFTSFSCLVVVVRYDETGRSEVAYDRNGFGLDFTGSSVTGTTSKHFVLARRGGWPMSPSIVVQGADSDGNAVVDS